MNDKVLVMYNRPCGSAFEESEAGVLRAVDAVGKALAALGTQWAKRSVRRLPDVAAALAEQPGVTVFNLVEALEESPWHAQYVPALCEAFGCPCTGADTRALLLTLDKAQTKARLSDFGVIAPPGCVVPPGGALPGDLPPAPLFVKPLISDGSEGITARSLVRDPERELAAAVAYVQTLCGQPVLVERYIEGRELSMAVMEREGQPFLLPVAEIDFSLFPKERGRFIDYDLKWHPETLPGCVSPRKVPAELTEAEAATLRDLACRTWTACERLGYARIDCRMDGEGRVYVLEVNANCDLSPLAGFFHALRVAGIGFERFVAEQIDMARRRAP